MTDILSPATNTEYDFARIEPKWQKYWKENQTFRTPSISPRPKYYVLDMFPYPSGSGLHVGHVEGYTATDIITRFKSMQGFNVLHPMGWDAFGLPAEQYAVKTGTHPKITTENNIRTYKAQLQRLGLAIDWEREINTTDPDYYRWTQWIFLQLYKKGLAYESNEPVNWCPVLGTVLANEEVIDGLSEVGGHPVIKKPIHQWVLKITEYADRLLDDLEGLDWPESTKQMQRNWIGRSEGLTLRFAVQHHSESFEVFTTAHHTLFGVTFCVLAPDHPLVSTLTTRECEDHVEDYVTEALERSDMDRMAEGKEKTGVFTGSYAINPINGEAVPIYIADYVLLSYGTGAVMGVPAHDARDHTFATKYEIPIRQVITNPQGKPTDPSVEEAALLCPEGVMVHSPLVDGLTCAEAKTRIAEWAEAKGTGKRTVHYRLRDWVFSRQRYWGEPFPLFHEEDGTIQLCDESELPVHLPDVTDYKPTGGEAAPLSKAHEWVNQVRDGKPCKRETNIMPQWAGSCWYYFRYLDPKNYTEFCSKEQEQAWLPVDLYVGGAEHANLHLLYARFWHKVLYDLGLVSCKEPFKRLLHPGLVLGPNGEKMSKSRGNVINPEEVILEWGADSLRMFELFLGPFHQVKPWQTNGVSGIHRFLKRFWRLVLDESGQIQAKLGQTSSPEFTKLLHQTIQKVTEDTEAFKFNTAISAMMECLNQAYKESEIARSDAEKFLLLLAPYAPHLSEELWSLLGHKESLYQVAWPTYDPCAIAETQITYSIMVNGKLRDTMAVEEVATQADVIAQAKMQIARHLEGHTIRKEIFVPGKVINFVL